MKPGTYLFEPHGLHGVQVDDIDGDFPFGYISRVAPNGVPSPLFELRFFLGTEAEAKKNADMIVAACNAFKGA